MTSNKKLVTMLIFIGALALTLISAYLSTFLIGATDLPYIMTVTQQKANIDLFASLLSLTVLVLLISDMN